MAKIRLDQLLVDRGLVESREKAKRLIISGKVMYKTERLSKPGMLYKEDLELHITEDEKYVSRGGIKLEGFFADLKLNINNFFCIDVGSSTGGYTDYMLQNGISSIVCVDVGQGLLHWKLRNDKRVTVHEKINARNLDSEISERDFDLATIDVSFISLKLIIPPVIKLLKNNGWLICLVKPQFEAGREFVGKGGVVKSRDVQIRCVEEIMNFCTERGLMFYMAKPCCIKGPAGNQEYFACFKKVCNS